MPHRRGWWQHPEQCHSLPECGLLPLSIPLWLFYFSLQQCPDPMKILWFWNWDFFFLESSFLGILLNMARQCFAQNGVFVDHCPIFHMILVGSFQLQAFWFYPWCPTDRAEQFICWPLLLFKLHFWIWGRKRMWFISCLPIWLLCFNLTAVCQTEKGKTPNTTNTTRKAPNLQLKGMSLWPTVFLSTVLVLSDGCCAFWSYQWSVIFMFLVS